MDILHHTITCVPSLFIVYMSMMMMDDVTPLVITATWGLCWGVNLPMYNLWCYNIYGQTICSCSHNHYFFLSLSGLLPFSLINTCNDTKNLTNARSIWALVSATLHAPTKFVWDLKWHKYKYKRRITVHISMLRISVTYNRIAGSSIYFYNTCRLWKGIANSLSVMIS
jgi:hypothetical protein